MEEKASVKSSKHPTSTLVFYISEKPQKLRCFSQHDRFLSLRFVVEGVELTWGLRGRCSGGSGGRTPPPRGRRKQRTTRGCDEAPMTPETDQKMIRLESEAVDARFILLHKCDQTSHLQSSVAEAIKQSDGDDAAQHTVQSRQEACGGCGWSREDVSNTAAQPDRQRAAQNANQRFCNLLYHNVEQAERPLSHCVEVKVESCI